MTAGIALVTQGVLKRTRIASQSRLAEIRGSLGYVNIGVAWTESRRKLVGAAVFGQGEPLVVEPSLDVSDFTLYHDKGSSVWVNDSPELH